MVDRIVPATTAGDLAAGEELLGMPDRGLVVAEPFSQWVIEYSFAGAVPDWGTAGVNIVADVAPFEEMKLRLLNASHSTLAYVACAMEISTVAEAMAQPAIERLLTVQMQEEMTPTLSGLGDFDVSGYRRALLQRLRNTGLAHRTRQIAMDGSAKIPQRFVPALEWHLDRQQDCPCTTLAIAAWIYHVFHDRHLEDPRAEEFLDLREQSGGDIAVFLEAVLALPGLLPVRLSHSEWLVSTLGSWLSEFGERGVVATVHEYWGRAPVMPC